MKKVILILIIIAFVTMSIQLVQCYGQELPGRLWLESDYSTRTMLILGYITATQLSVFFVNRILDDIREFVAFSKNPDTEKLADAKYQDIFATANAFKKMCDFEGVDTQNLIDMITELYKQPANQNIHFTQIASIARMKITGASEEEIKRVTERFRALSFEYLRKPR